MEEKAKGDMADKKITTEEALSIFKSYEKRIFDFDRENNDFKPAHYLPKEEGYYLTIRCGLTGIYTTIDMWKNGNWQVRILDGSTIIAYSRNKLELW